MKKINTPFVDVGLQYALEGLAVVPLHTPVKGRCTCGRSNCASIGKHPRTEHGWKDASKDPEQIELWGEMWPGSNIGIATEQSGLVAVEVDPQNNGDYGMADLIIAHGKLPRTVEDYRPTGGPHKLYKHPGVNIQGGDIAPGVQVIVKGGVAAPWSIHPSGEHRIWKYRPGKVPFADLPEWLIEQQLLKTPASEALPLEIGEANHIPRKAWMILQGTSKRIYGNKPNGAQDRSAQDEALLGSFAKAGWDNPSAWDKCIEYGGTHLKLIDKLRKDGEHEARRYFDLSWKNAVAYVTTHDTQAYKDALEIARTRKQWAISRPWPGQCGAYDQAVTAAHISIVERAGCADYHGGERTLAELAGCSRYAVRSANKRLIKAGVIELLTPFDPHKPSQAPRWRLLPLPQGVTPTDHSIGNPKNVIEWSVSGYTHDAFRTYFDRQTGKHKGLGKAAGQLWNVLQGEPMLTREIVKATGRGKRTVLRLLKRMEKEPLCMVKSEQTGQGFRWTAVKGVNLSAIAREVGTWQAAGRQRDWHAKERRKRKQKLKNGRR